MMRLKDIKQMSNISNFREKDTLISEIEDINNLDDTQEISDTRGKTNTCTKSGKIKVLLRIIIAFISGGGVTTLINKLLDLENKDLIQVGKFINSWPFVIVILAICMTVVLCVLILEIFKTKRIDNRNEELYMENRELKNNIYILGKKKDEVIEYNYKLQIQIAQKEEKIYYLKQMLSNKRIQDLGLKGKNRS